MSNIIPKHKKPYESDSESDSDSDSESAPVPVPVSAPVPVPVSVPVPVQSDLAIADRVTSKVLAAKKPITDALEKRPDVLPVVLNAFHGVGWLGGSLRQALQRIEDLKTHLMTQRDLIAQQAEMIALLHQKNPHQVTEVEKKVRKAPTHQHTCTVCNEKFKTYRPFHGIAKCVGCRESEKNGAVAASGEEDDAPADATATATATAPATAPATATARKGAAAATARKGAAAATGRKGAAAATVHP